MKALWIGLYQSDFMESKGKSGEDDRIQAVIYAARLKDRQDGRERAPYTTLDDALDRLREN